MDLDKSFEKMNVDEEIAQNKKQNESEKDKRNKKSKNEKYNGVIYGEWVQYAKKIVMDCQKIFLVFQIKMDMSGK